MAEVAVSGGVVIDAKPGMRQEVREDLEHKIGSSKCHPGQAGRLREDLGWCDTNSHGKIGRLGMCQLQRRQYALEGFDGPELDQDMRNGFVFLHHLTDIVRPKRARVLGAGRLPVVIYSRRATQRSSAVRTQGWRVISHWAGQ